MAKAIKDPEGNETRHLHQFADFAGKRVLEIGCGEGRLTWRYALASLSTVGLDPDRNALRVALADRPHNLLKKVHFSNAKSERLPFRSETFDVVLLAWSL
ncbi:MAG: class I SAM-dependent methyltransferase [Anaerolineales bacterium]|nr:class I SAM-dependent methyltransferase [Anaerolineales bacterium]NUQ86453.1 class I SAM-dependent methyltransferase [Anaerolineales bacterium]